MGLCFVALADILANPSKLLSAFRVEVITLWAGLLGRPVQTCFSVSFLVWFALMDVLVPWTNMGWGSRPHMHIYNTEIHVTQLAETIPNGDLGT